MRNIVTSLILILALFSCPLLCSWASAHGLACCGECPESVEALVANDCSDTVCECCRDERSSSRRQPDQQHSDNSHCQGICGGAVIDSAIDFDVPQLPSLASYADFEALSLSEQVSRSHLYSLQSSPPLPAQASLRALRILILC